MFRVGRKDPMLSEELCAKHGPFHPMTPFNTHSNPGWGYILLSPLCRWWSCVSERWVVWISAAMKHQSPFQTQLSVEILLMQVPWAQPYTDSLWARETKSLCLYKTQERTRHCNRYQALGPHVILSQGMVGHSQRQGHSTPKGVIVTQKSLLQKYFASQKV